MKDWIVEKSPRYKLPEDIEVEVGELTVREERMRALEIGGSMVVLPMRITQGGQVITNWGILHSMVSDASGNVFPVFGGGKMLRNDWMLFPGTRPLDPAKPWRIKADLGRDSAFPATNVYSFTVGWPMGGTLQTNLGRFPARISFLYGNFLNVELTNRAAETRLTLVAAEDSARNNLDDWVGSWGQHNFSKKLKLSLSGGPTEVHATVAIHPNYTVEFTLQPQLQKTRMDPAQ